MKYRQVKEDYLEQLIFDKGQNDDQFDQGIVFLALQILRFGRQVDECKDGLCPLVEPK